jgi:hypothetical protein
MQMKCEIVSFIPSKAEQISGCGDDCWTMCCVLMGTHSNRFLVGWNVQDYQAKQGSEEDL